MLKHRDLVSFKHVNDTQLSETLNFHCWYFYQNTAHLNNNNYNKASLIETISIGPT